MQGCGFLRKSELRSARGTKAGPGGKAPASKGKAAVTKGKAQKQPKEPTTKAPARKQLAMKPRPAKRKR